jgi:hypothetical protein
MSARTGLYRYSEYLILLFNIDFGISNIPVLHIKCLEDSRIGNEIHPGHQ